MTEDEAKAVAAVAAQCLTWSGWRRWEPAMLPSAGTRFVACSSRPPASSVYSDDGDIVGMIRDGDSVATLTRMADEHRPQCEWETSAAAEEVGEPAWTPAEARLQAAGRTFAVLRRLDYHVWDAWLHPAAPGGAAAGVQVTRNGVSYEMAFAAVFRTMDDDMPAGFGLNYLNKRITPGLPGPAQA